MENHGEPLIIVLHCKDFYSEKFNFHRNLKYLLGIRSFILTFFPALAGRDEPEAKNGRGREANFGYHVGQPKSKILAGI